MIELIFLGSGGGMPTPDRDLASLLINYNGRKILVDCGEGTQVSMKKVGRGFKTLDIICITHIHGDHILGLPGLLSTIANSGKTTPMMIIGPSGIYNAVKSLLYIVGYLPYKVHIIENSKGEIDFSDKSFFKKQDIDFKEMNLLINTLELEHSMPCIGYSFIIKRNPKFSVEKATENKVPQKLWSVLQRQESTNLNGILYTSDMVLGEDRKGIKITYITDTRPKETIKDFALDSDIMICEGTYGKDEDIEKAIKNKHMTFKEASKLAIGAGVKKLFLTHFSPALINPEEYIHNAKDEFKESYLAHDRLIESISFDKE